VTANSYRVNTLGGVLSGVTGDDTRWGGTIGAGLEYAFAPNWSVGVEYNHLFMQDRTYTFTAPGGGFFGTDRIRQDIDLVTARLNYKFGGPTVARY
jgi:outer membrane immunogenic protein